MRTKFPPFSSGVCSGADNLTGYALRTKSLEVLRVVTGVDSVGGVSRGCIYPSVQTYRGVVRRYLIVRCWKLSVTGAAAAAAAMGWVPYIVFYIVEGRVQLLQSSLFLEPSPPTGSCSRTALSSCPIGLGRERLGPFSLLICESPRHERCRWSVPRGYDVWLWAEY